MALKKWQKKRVKKLAKRGRTTSGFSSSKKPKKNSRKAKNRKRSTAAKHRSSSNPGKKLREKIAQMKPRAWYSTTLSGAKVKVQRKGNSLVIRPASKRKR